jgi:protein TonB
VEKPIDLTQKTPPPEAPKPAPKPVVVAAPQQPAQVVPATPLPDLPPPRPRRFTVAMEATVGTGGVAVPVSASGSSWAFGGAGGDVDGANTPPSGAPGLPGGLKAGAAAVEAAELESWPKLAWQPSPEDLRSLYPEAARREGREGNVALKLLVSETGDVQAVRLVQGAGAGFDEVALQTVRRFRFEPGRRAGRPVSTWIPWNYRFRLDG